MKLTLREQLAQFSHLLQSQLFPAVEEATGELDEKARQLIATLEMIPPLVLFLVAQKYVVAGLTDGAVKG